MLRPSPRIVHLDRVRCPFCHDEIADGEPQLACNACRAWHHQACWDEGEHTCSACGSTQTGFVDKTRTITSRLLRRQRRDPKTEFRFLCHTCMEPIWAKRVDSGRLGQCPHCKQQMDIPPVETEETTPQNTLGMDIFVAPIVAALVGVVVTLVCGLFGAVGGGIADLASFAPESMVWPWAKAGMIGGGLWAYALSLLICVGVTDEGADRLPTGGKFWLFVGAIASVLYPVAVWFGALEPITPTSLHAICCIPLVYWLVGAVVTKFERKPKEDSEPAQGQARSDKLA